ncbi:MAG: alanyl-tRNA editing protein [Candidatus Heimdallarchaeota archaeon]|nr:MAG: alanyl-tRNA editing protein [Candidatus Heimdallarchaeota archaeon]
MIKALYLDDMQLKEFEAEVTSVKDGKYVVLNQTAFYPKSGGIANDEGTLTRGSEVFNVVYVGKFGGAISHEVDKEGLQVGDKVTGTLNWDRRYHLMRFHTAAHVLSGAFYKNLGAKITGNDIATLDQGRIDFNLEHFDRSLIEEQVENSNKIIQEDHPVDVYYLERSDVEKDPDLVKLAMGIPKGIKTIRIVDIKGFDRQPDGGCHIQSLKEIGKISIKKLVNKGKNNRRLYFTIE